MLRKYKRSNLVIFYVLLGTVSLYFFSRFMLPNGFAIAGHDSGLPLTAKSFMQTRLFAWDPRVNFGVDNSYLFGSLTLHFVDYLSSLVGNTQYAGNWFNLFFWLSALFVSATVFASSLESKLGIYFVLLFPPLTIFNFYIFQSIFILERAKYSVMVSMFIFLTIAFKVINQKWFVFPAAILASFALTIFNSGSFLGLPLYGGFIVVVAVLILSTIIWDLKDRTLQNALRFIQFLVFTGIFFLLLNAYQILPYIPGIIHKDFQSFVPADISARIEWTNYISKNTSLLSLFRFQGVPAWYETINTGSQDHPYAADYLSSKVNTLLSLVLPIIAFSSVALSSKKDTKKIILLFATIALVSMIFAAGTHPPFGFVYNYLYLHVPGFQIFRTPYYKFAGAFFVSMAALFAISISSIVKAFSMGSKTIGILLCGGALSLYFIYYRPLFSSEKNFSWKLNSTTKVTVPRYTYDLANWLISNNTNESRILIVPPLNPGDLSDSYTWNYWSLSPLPYSMNMGMFLSNDGGLKSDERAWVDLLYTKLAEGSEQEFINLAQKLNVEFMLLSEDSLNYPTDIYKKPLTSLKSTERVGTFGKLTLFRINMPPNNLVRTVNSFALVPSKQEYLSRELVQNFSYTVSLPLQNESTIGDIFNSEFMVQECVSCQIERRNPVDKFPGVRVLPSSPFYTLKAKRDLKALRSAESDTEKINYYLGRSLTQLSEIVSMFSLVTDDADVLVTIQSMSLNLDSVYEILKGSDIYESNFAIQGTILNYIDFIGGYLGRFTETEDFHRKSRAVREEILDVLWDINKIRNLYPETLIDIDKWNYKKVYNLSFEDDGRYKLYLLEDRFHHDTEGSFIMPLSIKLVDGDKIEEISLSSETKVMDKWLTIDLGERTSGTKELTMHFDSFPNMFEPTGLSREKFPSGEKGCFVGRIKDFDNNKRYVIKIELGGVGSDLSLYLRDPNRIYSPKHNFIEGEVKADINGDATSFKYYYDPISKPSEINLFVCRINESNPDVKGVVVNEIFEPLIVSRLQKEAEEKVVPKVNYQKINPTKYKVEIRDADGPFLLGFFNRFSQNWYVKRVDNFAIDEKHVLIDGFANGWIIDGNGDFDLFIEYSPQKMFVIGTAVTTTTGIFLLLLLTKFKIRRNAN